MGLGMTDISEIFIKLILKEKKLILQALHDEHMTAIAVYGAKRQMMISDIDILEKHISDKKL